MIDNAFRSVLPRFTGPLIAQYRRFGLTPNAVSVLGFVLALASAWCIVRGWAVAALSLWWLGRLADGTDGILARATGRSSAFGSYLDIVFDMAAYSAMVLAFDHVHPALHERWMLILLMYVLCITSALALGMQEAAVDLPARDNRRLRLGAGLAEGGETGIAYTLFLLLPAHVGSLTAVWIVLLAATVVARTLLAWRTLRP